MPVSLECTNEQQVRISVQPLTGAGNPAPVDGEVRCTVVSGESTVLPGNAPNEFVLRSGDNPGDTAFLLEADADTGEGVVLVQETVTLRVVSALAGSLGVEAVLEPKAPAA